MPNANQYVRLMPKRPLFPNEKGDPVDLGGFRRLAFWVKSLKTGDGLVEVQHAASAEDGAFVAILPQIALSGGFDDYFQVDDFLRYIRWVCSAGVTGEPVIAIDIVAKER